MDVLFIHQSFLGQFRHIARYLSVLLDSRVLAIGKRMHHGFCTFKARGFFNESEEA